MVFLRQIFLAPGSKNVLSYYSYRTRLLKENYRECNQENKFYHVEKQEGSAETPGGAEEIGQKIEAKFFMRGWGKNHLTKNELNLLSKNSIGKYAVIIHLEMQLQQK